MRRVILWLGLGVATLAMAAEVVVPAISSLPPGKTLPAMFRFISIPGIPHNTAWLERDQDVTVLRVESNNSAGSIALPYTPDPATTPLLTWRWKISRSLTSADTRTKTGDDYAARVYVFFDVPLESLSFVERTKIRIARAIAGSDVPTAALCYVWDNRRPIGDAQRSPYTQRAQMIVLQSGPALAGQWITQTRDIAADFRQAYGHEAPRVVAIALGNDTDNTHEQVSTWFGDVRFHTAAD